MPADYDVPRPYAPLRFPSEVLEEAYHSALNASNHAVRALDDLAVAARAPSRVLALARAAAPVQSHRRGSQTRPDVGISRGLLPAANPFTDARAPADRPDPSNRRSESAAFPTRSRCCAPPRSITPHRASYRKPGAEHAPLPWGIRGKTNSIQSGARSSSQLKASRTAESRDRRLRSPRPQGRVPPGRSLANLGCLGLAEALPEYAGWPVRCSWTTGSGESDDSQPDLPAGDLLVRRR